MINTEFRQFLRSKGYSASQLAVALGVSRQCVSQWCLGQKKPSLAILPKLSKVLKTPIKEILLRL